LSDGASPDVDVAPELKGVLEDPVHVKKVGLQVVTFAGSQKFGSADQILEFTDSELGHDDSDLERKKQLFTFTNLKFQLKQEKVHIGMTDLVLLNTPIIYNVFRLVIGDFWSRYRFRPNLWLCS
jgi:hypothetical protein